MSLRWEVADEVVPPNGQEPALKAHGFRRLGVIRARLEDPDPAFVGGVLREVWVDEDGTALTLAARAALGDADLHTVFSDGTIVRTFGFTDPRSAAGASPGGALLHADVIDEVIVGRGLTDVLVRHRLRADEIREETPCWPIATLAHQVQLNNRAEEIRASAASAVAASLVGLVCAEALVGTLVVIALLTGTFAWSTAVALVVMVVAVGGVFAGVVVSQKVPLPWGPKRIEPARWADSAQDS
jgi:hypothetical protein